MCSERIASWASVLLCASLAAQQQLTPKEALELAFPKAQVERTTVALDEQQQQHLGERLGAPWKSAVVFQYEAKRDGAVVGTAFFDTHRVRGQLETLLVAVGPDGKLLRVEVVAFAEPIRYLPKRSFYEQFAGRLRDAEPKVEAVETVAGATLTVKATIAAAQRVLALYEELHPAPSPKPTPEPPPRPPADGKTQAGS